MFKKLSLVVLLCFEYTALFDGVFSPDFCLLALQFIWIFLTDGCDAFVSLSSSVDIVCCLTGLLTVRLWALCLSLPRVLWFEPWIFFFAVYELILWKSDGVNLNPLWKLGWHCFLSVPGEPWAILIDLARRRLRHSTRTRGEEWRGSYCRMKTGDGIQVAPCQCDQNF